MAAIISNSTGQAVTGPGQQDDPVQTLGLNESQMHRFGGILRSINLEAIPGFVSNVRRSGHHDTGIVSSAKISDSDLVPCKIAGLPLCGSFHIVFTLEFDDGVKWMLKISANGHHFDSVAAAALISEARTMQLLKSETTIPVPAVYAFDASSSNDLNCPFILMERMHGKPLYQGWFDDEIPKARLEHFRVRALQSLAEAMTQLNKFTLNRGGALEFDSTGKPIGLRGAKVVDAVAMYGRGIVSEEEPEANGKSAKNDNHHGGHDDNRNNEEIQNTNRKEADDGDDKSQIEDDDDDDEDIICEKGPFDCPKSAFLFDLDRSDAHYKDSDYTHGCYKALRIFTDWAFANSHDYGRRFVLTHPDLDVQNVLVAEDGTLRGLIDWDGVASVPREIGCAQYPLWLMRDWVPFYYLYDIRAGRTEEDADYEESSPAELASYRALYAHFIEKEIERQTGGPDRVTTFGTLPKQEAQLTRRSLVMRDLDLAASSPFLTMNILCHILFQVEQVTWRDWRDVDLELEPDSSCSSQHAVDSDSDNNTQDNSDSDEEGPEIEAIETDEGVSSCVSAAASVNPINEGAKNLEHVLPQSTTKVSDGSSGAQQRDHGSQTSSEVCQIESREVDTEQSSSADLNAYSSSNSAPLGWTRRLLCFGCNAAENGLRRLVKIGHVLDDTIDEVAEAFPEVGKQQHGDSEHPDKRTPAQAIDLLDHRQLSGSDASEAVETERSDEINSIQAMARPEKPQNNQPIRPTVELRGTLSTRETVEHYQPNQVASIQPTTTFSDLTARKDELFKAEKARRKSQYRADKAAIEKETTVWENIALAVRCRGISLEQLQLNQGKIASWVVDTLGDEEKQEDDLVVDNRLQSAAKSAGKSAFQSQGEPVKVRLDGDLLEAANFDAGLQSAISEVDPVNVTGSKRLQSKVLQASPSKRTVTTPDTVIFEDERDKKKSYAATSFKPELQASWCLARNSPTSKQRSIRKAKNKMLVAQKDELSPGFGNGGPLSSKSFTHITTLNFPVSASESETLFNEINQAGRLIPEQKTMIVEDECIGGAAKAMSAPSLRPHSTPENPGRPEKTFGSLQSLCSFGTSCLQKIFSNGKNPESDRGALTLDSNVNGGNDRGSDRSDADESCKSSATSLSDGEEEVGESVKAKEEGDEVFKAVIASAEGSLDPGCDANDDIDVCEALETNEAMEKNGPHHDATIAGKVRQKIGPNQSCLSRRACHPLSEEGIEIKDTGNPAKTNNTAGSLVDENPTDMDSTPNHEHDSDTKSDQTEDEAGDDNGGSPSEKGDDDEEDMWTFRDDGEFCSQNVFNLLGMDMLDELRLLRMQEGFLKLLEQY